jgi:hypothetical protein
MLLFQLFTEMNISFAQEWGEAAIAKFDDLTSEKELRMTVHEVKGEIFINFLFVEHISMTSASGDYITLILYLSRSKKYCHREEIYREETRGKLCHADIFSLLTIENYINSLFY